VGRFKDLDIEARNADPERVKRGHSSRRRGHDWERSLAKRLGGSRVGQYGGATDVVGWDGHLIVQAKVGGSFSERYWGWLTNLNPKADQLRALIVADSPGPGGRRRAMVVMVLEEFEEWHGRIEPAAEEE
jgi:hypothetical protein